MHGLAITLRQAQGERGCLGEKTLDSSVHSIMDRLKEIDERVLIWFENVENRRGLERARFFQKVCR